MYFDGQPLSPPDSPARASQFSRIRVRCRVAGAQAQALTQKPALTYSINELHSATAARAAVDSSSAYSAKHSASAARQKSLPLTLATVVLHSNLCPADYRTAAAVAAAALYTPDLRLEKRITLGKPVHQHFSNGLKRRALPHSGLLDLCLLSENPALLTSEVSAATGNASVHNLFLDATQLSRNGPWSDASPIPTGTCTAQ